MLQGNNQDYQPQPYQQPRSQVEIILDNIIKSVVSIFIIVIGFFLIVMVVSMLDTQTAVQYSNYTNDFTVNSPLLAQTVYTRIPMLSSIQVQKYNSSNTTYGNVDSADWSFDTTTSGLTVNAGVLEHFITGLRVNAETDYATSPHLSVLTMASIALIIASIASIFGIYAYRRHQNQNQNYLR